MATTVLLFILGLILLIFGGNFFVDGASGIAKRFKMSELLIGATIVSIGTTLPEVMVSATSAVSGHSEISYGNAIGSIICNTALIAAITVSFRPSAVNKNALKLPITFYFISALIFALFAYINNGFTRFTGILLLVIFVAYMIITVRSSGKNNAVVSENNGKKQLPLPVQIIQLIAGAAAIAFGARLLVNNGMLIAEAMGVPESVIALTFVALGTSLPELITAVISLIKGHSQLSLGNIIGANLFNIALVCAMSITLRPYSLPAEKTIFGANASLVLDLPLTFITMIILSVPALMSGKLRRWQGITLLLMYAAFCVYQFAF